MSTHRVIWPGDLGGGAVAQHVFGQGQHDRAGSAGGRDLKRLVDEFGDAFGHIDLRHPFGERAEHAAEIDFLKRLAVDLMARHLADQHDHRRRILKCRVDADRRVARTRPARHQQHTGLAGQFAVGLRHKSGAPFLAAGHKPNFGCVEQCVEHFEITFAGDAEGHVDTMRPQRSNDELTAGQRRKVACHVPALSADDRAAI